MANVRFLDQVSVNSFANGGNTSTSFGATIPRIILPGTSFKISANTSVSTYRLTVAGTLILELGPQIVLPDGSVVRANSQLYVSDILENQGTIINEGIIEIGGDAT
jgi:hypothetical protein